MNTPQPSLSSVFTKASKKLRFGICWIVFFSFFINVLALALPFYSLQVFDRVLTSQSIDTLWLLSAIALLFVTLYALLDWVRNRMFLALSENWNHDVSSAVHVTSIYASKSGKTQSQSILQLMKSIRNTLSLSLSPLFDLPWTSLLFLLLVALHPLYGVISAITITGLVLLSLLNYRYKKNSDKGASKELTKSTNESIRALSMTRAAAGHFSNQDSISFTKSIKTQSYSKNIAGFSRFFRYLAQIAIVSTGAILVIDREVTAGTMIAASMLAGRVFSPYEAMVSHLHAWLSASDHWYKLKAATKAAQDHPIDVSLPEAKGHIQAQGVTILHPGSTTSFLKQISLDVPAGCTVAFVGESGCGKSTLLKAFAGLRQPAFGHIRLDGATYEQWYSEKLSGVLSYYSTDSEFMDGTILENISRFSALTDATKVHQACLAVGLHETILKWPKGYETRLGQDVTPSSSEFHRLLLARALFSQPKVLILDQPDAFLGPLGEKLLKKILVERKKLKLTTLFATNHSALLNFSDRIVVLDKGKIQSDAPTHQLAQAYKAQLKPA
ncbi:ATP-binding cassette domain-containing protein [Vibrio agarivorans]|uniref:ATP-binding cassette domain-containing protein n=1 Tax=Vibrio agarivorans TaxID=153622 RepID=UPI002232C379|nr:ATP-binding cassette domain-containing protein [Vibrio agarivorans]